MQLKDDISFSESIDMIGKNAASVFPDAVVEERRRFLSVSNKTRAASICTGLSSFQPFLYINGANRL